jgi:hypothetical protein
MTASELKLYLMQKIIKTDNPDLLLKIKSLLEENNYLKFEENSSSVNEPALKYENLENSNIRIFTPSEQKKIDQALREYENGECISNEEAQIELEKWFKEQEK